MWYKLLLTSEFESALFYSDPIDIKMNVSFFEKKSYSKNLACTSKWDWG